MTGGYYSSSDGSYTRSSGRRLTDIIPVNEGEQLDYTIYCNPAQLEVVAFDSNMDIVLASSVAGRASRDAASYTVPSGISYLRFCEGGSTTRTGEVVFKDSIYGIKALIDNLYKALSVDKLHVLSPSQNCQLLYFNTNLIVTSASIKRLYNRNDGFRLTLNIYEPTHPSTAWEVQFNENWTGIRTGFYEASGVYGPSYIKVGFYLFGEVSGLDSVNISVPVDCIEQDEYNPINDIFEVRNEIGSIISNGSIVKPHWKCGRLDYNSGYTGWVSSSDYWNSGFITLPAGNYKITGNTTSNGRAPMIIKFNNDYTFNSILVAGTSSVASYTFTLNEETIIACNTQATNVSNFRLEKLNEGSLDICENFSDVNNQLYYKGQPIASETSISTLVTDLPVGDGTGVESGYAYIDSTDRAIKVKA